MFGDISDVREFNSGNIKHVESMLYTGYKNNMEVFIKLLKYYDIYNDRDICNNKIYIINELYKNKDNINISELVLPIDIARIYNNNIYVVYPKIEGYNLSNIIKDKNVSVRDIIGYFIEIGNILEKMESYRKRSNSNLYLGDLHESNFVIDKYSNGVYVVDMDSCKINNSIDNGGKYLALDDNINLFSKYEMIRNNYVIDRNTDIYCYVMMILNYIFDIDMYDITIGDYYNYMEYLRYVGISNELIDMLSRIYSNDDNINPYMLLNEFINTKDKIDSNKYKLLKRR